MDIKPVRCRIPEILHQQRRSQVWLADQLDISPQHLNDITRMRSIINIGLAARIAHVLKVKIDDLYVWEWHGE
jgi:DNA-binding XRE family transcriptional regulator